MGLVTNYRGGGRQNGGTCEVLPYEKGTEEKVLAMLKGVNFEIFCTWYLEVLAILKGRCKNFHSLKGGGG